MSILLKKSACMFVDCVQYKQTNEAEKINVNKIFRRQKFFIAEYCC